MSEHPRLRAVCFDFDQTLGYFHPSHFALYVRAAAEHGVDVTEDALAAAPLDDAWARWMTPEGVDHSEASTSEAAFRAVRTAIHRNRYRGAGVEVDDATIAAIAERLADLEGDAAFYRLYDDALPALERLARHRIEAVVVSNHVWRLPEVVRGLGCGARFEGVITSARAGYRKPHPGIYAAALRLLGRQPGEVLFVGDSLSADVLGPRAAGMRAVLLDRDGTREAPEGVEVIRTLLDVPVE